MLIIQVPESAYESQEVVLGNTTYNLLFKYNTSDSSWYLEVRNSSLNRLLPDLKIVSNQNLTSVYDYTKALPNGNLWCRRSKVTQEPITRDNFGEGLSYELLWITSQEEIQGQLDGIIQLSS